MRELTLGSLFDGSGGFPLAAALEGIRPLWASEVEPYPIAVTRSRFPHMKHYGDVSKINGADIDPVDILSFGSPCQDLSVAGLRRGLRHEAAGDEETTRSGLFLEAIRIIKEMREATNGVYPTYAIWENVTGAFSSGKGAKGEDFRRVLNEFVQIVEPGAEVPPPPQGKWAYTDILMGDGFSIAYRVFDAAKWGVPQRRRRIYLVADFRGQRAGKILFERVGLRGHPAPRREARQGTAAETQNDVGTADSESVRGIINLNKGDVQSKQILAPNGIPPSLYAGKKRGGGGELYVMATQQANAEIAVDKSPTITAAAGMSGNNQPVLIMPTPVATPPYTLKIRQGVERDSAGKKAGKGPLISENLSMTLGVSQDQYLFQPKEVYCVENHPNDSRVKIDENGKVQALTQRMGTGGNNTPLVMYGISAYESNAMKSPNPHSGIYEADTARTLDTNGGNPACNQGGMAIVYPEKTVVQAFVQNQREEVRELGEATACLSASAGMHQQTFVLEGNGSRPSHRGDGWSESDVMYTLNTVDRHSVAYAIDQQGGKGGANYAEEIMPTLCSDSHGTLTSSNANGAQRMPDKEHFNCVIEEDNVEQRYIVRRLTPLECCRLQGFPDGWGETDEKTDFTDEEFRFWHEVRNTHAAINGKKRKAYTKKQMLTWYNKLHTDSAEYKMWGNGLALPCARYVMQGIVDAVKEDEENA